MHFNQYFCLKKYHVFIENHIRFYVLEHVSFFIPQLFIFALPHLNVGVFAVVKRGLPGTDIEKKKATDGGR